MFQLYYVFELLSLLLCVIHLLIVKSNTFCSYISTLLALNSSISDCDMLVEITVLLKID